MATKNTIRVLIVDDHAMLRSGLAVFLISFKDLELIGEAADGEEALLFCAYQQPDVILMDLVMPRMDGITATSLLRQKYPDIQIIALSGFNEGNLVRGILNAGAISYIFKKASADELAKAIRAAKMGLSTFAPEVAELLVNSPQARLSLLNDLTVRECEVLTLVAKGMRNNEIAEQLKISLSTTKSHVSSIFSKLQIASRSEAIAFAIEHKLKPVNRQ